MDQTIRKLGKLFKKKILKQSLVDHCIIAAKKCYCIYTVVDGVETIYNDMFKIKGMDVKRDKLIDVKKVGDVRKLINNNNYVELNMLYQIILYYLCCF